MAGYPVRKISVDAGESLLFDRVFSGGLLVRNSAPKTADALICSGPAILIGYKVHVALSSTSATIEDGLTAGAGQVQENIPDATAVGNYGVLPNNMAGGIYCPTGIYLNFTGSTGTISVLYMAIP